MPYAAQHRKHRQRVAQQKYRSAKPCPCSLCLNLVELSESDVNSHIRRFGLAESTLDSTSARGHETESIEADAESSSFDEFPESESSRTSTTASDPGKASSIKPTEDSTVSYEIDSSTLLTDGGNKSDNADMYRGGNDPERSCSVSSSGTNNDYDSVEFPDFLSEINEEDELYSSSKAKMLLFEGSSVTVLQALCGYLAWFTEHPGTSKSALSDLLSLHHKQILPDGNNLPSSFDEAYSFIRPFLLPFVVYEACPNDCILFRKTDRYDYSTLENCPICNSKRYTAQRIPARKFSYYPLGPRWKRMYGNASIAEVLQSHDMDQPAAQDNCLQDLIGSPSWKNAYDAQGFFEAERRGISLQLSTDGVNPFSSNKVIYSMWPIMLTVLNFPKCVRNLFSNMMLVGIIPDNGGHEPKSIDPYLEVVVDVLLSLSGSPFYDSFRKAPFAFKVQILSYVLDYPGLNKLFNSTGANSFQGCMWER